MNIDQNDLIEQDVIEEINRDEGLDDQSGGKVSQSVIVSKIFSPRTRASFTRVIRGIVRTGTGISADIITVGAGGDVVVNSVFAVESSLSFIKNIQQLIISLKSSIQLFNQLFIVDRKKKIPLVSKLNLDDGFQSFQNRFETILNNHIQNHGTKLLDRIYQSILGIIDKITTTVSDWIACLFPDTAGLAGEIAKNVLDYVVKHGYTYIYNLVSILPDNMQKMITNSYALKKLIHHAVAFLRNLIKNMSPNQISQVVQSLGIKLSDFVNNPILKSTINIGTTMASNLASIGITSFSTSSNMTLANTQNIIVFVIDKYITPNINQGVDLFNQLFPIFLMFTLFIEDYPKIINGSSIPRTLTMSEKKRIVTKKIEKKYHK